MNSIGLTRLRIRWILLLLVSAVIGVFVGLIIIPDERIRVEQYLLDYPNASETLHQLRPDLLILLVSLPFLGLLLYRCCGILDRHLICRVASTFAICLGGFILIWLLLDLQNNYSDFRDSENRAQLLGQYYLVQVPSLLVLLSPFALLLSSLYVLNKLSSQRELIAMIQTGRSTVRIVSPILCLGICVSLFLTILNYHWVTWGDGYKESVKGFAKHDTLVKARNILAFSESGKRLWFVGLFPQEFNNGAALKNIEVTQLDEQNRPTKRLRAESAQWEKATGKWTLQNVSPLSIDNKEIPTYSEQLTEIKLDDWEETPAQLLNPGLPAESLSLPELSDWLNSSQKTHWIDLQPYKTQWHYRLSQPWNSLISVLLAAPLGIVFSRRGTLGGITVAIILSALMLFSNEIFLAMGAGGYLTPWIAAWGANLLFAFIALILLMRRLQNRPIYASVQKLFALLGGKS